VGFKSVDYAVIRATPLAMNIFEFIFFLANTAIGVASAKLGFKYFGWLGGVLGFEVGWMRQRIRRKGMW